MLKVNIIRQTKGLLSLKTISLLFVILIVLNIESEETLKYKGQQNLARAGLDRPMNSLGTPP
jgi:hypothetical protein